MSDPAASAPPADNAPAGGSDGDDFRIGQGYDIHRLLADDSPGAGVCLAGVRIVCPLRIEAHSDGDVIVHALIDAMLGALALGDLGEHFPDSDARNHRRHSATMLEQICGDHLWPHWRVVNVDTTVIAETPRLSDHRMRMRHSLAGILKTDIGRVSIKATTCEGQDSIGAGRAIACHAVLLLKKIPSR